MKNVYVCTEHSEYGNLLWAIIGQAVMDATSLAYCEVKGCPYAVTCKTKRKLIPLEENPSIALQWLTRILGRKHMVVRATREARRNGREIRCGNMAGGAQSCHGVAGEDDAG